jgi:hypothetical protein
MNWPLNVITTSTSYNYTCTFNTAATVYGAGGGGGNATYILPSTADPYAYAWGGTGYSSAATPEEVEQRRQETEERVRQVHAAKAKARELLLVCLDEEQRRDYEERHYFTVTSDTGRRWRIKVHQGQSGNVELLGEHGQAVARYCAHPPEYLPDGDAWLAQKLALEADEGAFLRVANIQWHAVPAGLPQAA